MSKVLKLTSTIYKLRPKIMARFTFLLLILASSFITVSAQPTDTTTMSISIDSTNRILDSLNRAALERNAKQGQEVIYTLQPESTGKQKRKAITNIAIGIFFLVVLIVGLLRRKKKVPVVK